MARCLLIHGVNQRQGAMSKMARVFRLHPDGEELGAQVPLPDLLQVHVPFAHGSYRAEVEVFVQKALGSIGVSVDDDGGILNGSGLLSRIGRARMLAAGLGSESCASKQKRQQPNCELNHISSHSPGGAATCKTAQALNKLITACFTTSRPTSAMARVRGMSLGQTSTQFCAYPHSWMPPSPMSAMRRSCFKALPVG